MSTLPAPTTDDPELDGNPLPPAPPTSAVMPGVSLLTAGFWSATGTVVSQLYTMVGSILTARFLGAASVGRVSFIALVEGTIFVLLSQGLPRALMRFTGESVGRGDEGDVRSLLSWSTRLGAAAAVASGAGLAAAGFLGAYPRWAWVFAGIACTASVLQSYPGAFLTGLQRWRTVTLAGLIPVSAGIIAKVVLLSFGLGLNSLFGVDAVAASVTLVATLILARRALHPLSHAPESNRQLQRDALRFGLISTLGILVTFVVWRRTEVFFLEHYSTDVQVALYSIPFATVSALLVVPQGLGAVLAPAFATLLGAGAHRQIAETMARALRTTALLSVFLAAATIALGPTLLRLVYGPEFRTTSHVLLVLALPFPLVAVMYTCLSALLGLRRQWFVILTDAVAAIFNLALDAVLIRRYAAMGAAEANAIAQTLGSVPVIVYTLRFAHGAEWHLLTLLRGALVAVAGGVVAWLVVGVLGGLPGLVVGTFAAGVTWVSGVILCKGLAAEDAAWLRAALKQVLGRNTATATES